MIYLSGIAGDSIVDGPGIRTTFFSQGCPHHCPGCHNPETWAFQGGTPMETQDMVAIVKQNPLCRGVTFSGGEPFAQPEGFLELAIALKKEGYEVASYTGYTFEALLSGTDAQRALLENVDILIDGPFILAEKSLEIPFRGSKNQRILDIRQSLAVGKAVEATSARWQGEY